MLQPTLLEVLVVTIILAASYEILFAVITLVTITGYVVFTLLITEWRSKIRRVMNEKDNECNDKACHRIHFI